MAAVTRAPPQSRTLVNSQRRPSETATVVRSCPIETATRAASARSPGVSGSPPTARSRAKASMSMPTSSIFAAAHVAAKRSTRSR